MPLVHHTFRPCPPYMVISTFDYIFFFNSLNFVSIWLCEYWNWFLISSFILLEETIFLRVKHLMCVLIFVCRNIDSWSSFNIFFFYFSYKFLKLLIAHLFYICSYVFYLSKSKFFDILFDIFIYDCSKLLV